MIHDAIWSKIIIIGPVPPPVHGVTVAIERVLRSHLNDRFRIIHIDTSDHRDISTIGRLDWRNYALALRSYFRLIRICRNERPDLVYVPISQTRIGFLRDSGYLLLARLFGKSRTAIHLHGGYFSRFFESCGPLMRWFIDRTMGLVDSAIVLAECFRPIFGRWLPEAAIHVVPNGTDLSIPGLQAKLEQSDSRDVLRITYLSSLLREKGIADFAKAARHCAGKRNDLMFQAAGEWQGNSGQLQSEIANLTRDLPTGMFRLLGRVDGESKATLLGETDIFVLPTYYPFEGQPTVILEAMAAGCAIVASWHASIPEMIQDGVNGLLVPPQKPELLAETILSLAEDPSLCRRLGREAYRTYQNHFTTVASNDALGRAFDSILAPRVREGS